MPRPSVVSHGAPPGGFYQIQIVSDPRGGFWTPFPQFDKTAQVLRSLEMPLSEILRTGRLR
jgi:hypothetical protein